jgi:hypothetical protein
MANPASLHPLINNALLGSQRAYFIKQIDLTRDYNPANPLTKIVAVDYATAIMLYINKESLL